MVPSFIFFESILKPNDVDALGFYDYIYWDEKKIVSMSANGLNMNGELWRIAKVI